MAEKVLEQLRTELIKRLLEAIIKGLLDDLQDSKVLGNEEIEEIVQKMKTRSDQARDLIDGVRKKGRKASKELFKSLKKRDISLYESLKIDSLLETAETGATCKPASTLHSTTDKQDNLNEVYKMASNPRGLCVTTNNENFRNPKRKCDRSQNDVDKQDNLNEVYKMASNPRGLCVIINNENFANPKKKRNGSQNDVDSLKALFKYLGFLVEVKIDKTADEIKALMTQYSQDDRHGDCFVCCVMSHGDETGVKGCDEQTCHLNDITSPFDGVNCHSLLGKPKVFFIQACRGRKMQNKVAVTDSADPIQTSDSVSYSIPKDSDFLIALSTVEGYFSIRNSSSGSWFIQSLCKHLKEGSEQDQDILRILTKVNNDVSRREATVLINQKEVDGKMTPQPQFTLRKILFFKAPKDQAAASKKKKTD